MGESPPSCIEQLLNSFVKGRKRIERRTRSSPCLPTDSRRICDMMFRSRWSLCGLREAPRRWVSDLQTRSNLLATSGWNKSLANAMRTGNFMLSLELRSLRNTDLAIITAAQPVGFAPASRSDLIGLQSLPPPSLPSSVFYVPSISTSYLPPCIIPWPFRSLCPSRLLDYGGKPDSKIRERRANAMFASPAQGKDVVLLRKELMEGVMLNPGRGGDAVIGSAFVSIGELTNELY